MTFSLVEGSSCQAFRSPSSRSTQAENRAELHPRLSEPAPFNKPLGVRTSRNHHGGRFETMGGCGGCSYKGMSTAVEDTFVGVRFGDETNLTLCRTEGVLFAKDEKVIVELEHGPAYGRIERSPMPVFKPCQKSNARLILRHASNADEDAFKRKIQNELTARAFCRQRAQELNLEMKVSKVEFSLNGRHATFYFTANGRVDFRQLVRDLARRFSTRVKMVQVGARDEAALLGGIGICGRTLCCSTWLTDFKPISIQMAKRQNLSLNPSKISGQCGRLLCCLAYEDPRYQKPKRRRSSGSSKDGIKSTSPRPENHNRERSKNRIAGGAR